MLELLAPARNAEIGIAAVDCGADAVYVAGPAFGAREAAGNSVEDVARLCDYAHKYGVRVYAAVNTILYDDELDEAGNLLVRLQSAGVDAVIAQDVAIPEIARRRGVTVPFHASTQCSIRTPERARFMESLGFSRLVLERELSLSQVRDIAKSVSSEIEFFVHGAICVCYNGQCYLSEYLAGRSSNRGACAQPCRSRYDLVSEDGKVLARDKALLSLKDYNLLDRLADLADAGVCSFKIEGRLKNASYVRNVVRQYSMALDRLVESSGGQCRRASFGRVVKGFTPDLSKTFNRGYTSLYIDGERDAWASMDAPKNVGECIGKVCDVKAGCVKVKLSDNGTSLANGDGFAVIANGEVSGFRGDVCNGDVIRTDGDISLLRKGMPLYRNVSAGFEKSMDAMPCLRLIPVSVSVSFHGSKEEGFRLGAVGVSEDGRTVSVDMGCGNVAAENPERVKAMAVNQLGKTSGRYSFTAHLEESFDVEGDLPLVRAAGFNAMRRELAERLDAVPCNSIPLFDAGLRTDENVAIGGRVSYKADIANRVARQAYVSRGAADVEDAYEIAHQQGVELMRTKYCIKHELGICPVRQGAKPTGRLFLRNNGIRLRLGFDCAVCEMTVSAEE